MTVETAQEWIKQGAYFESRRDGRVFYRDRGTGSPVVMLHGFPTWSYEWAPLARSLEADHRVILLDFPGYGASDKHSVKSHTVAHSADIVEQLLGHLAVPLCYLVVHDYGSIVGQELLDRRWRNELGFAVASLTMLNASIFAGAYRPTNIQRALLTPGLGTIVARLISPAVMRRGLNRVRGKPLGEDEFRNLSYGMRLQGGAIRAHHLLSYVTERRAHGPRWEQATERYDGPVQLIWGDQDPVSGRAARELAQARLPRAQVEIFPEAGHFPHAEEPERAAGVIRRFLEQHA
ncbi:MAG: alpha/beta hydrolase [Myxococcota bacterium]